LLSLCCLNNENDTERFFKVTKPDGSILYLLYGNVLGYYNCRLLGEARCEAIKSGDKFEVVCDLYPLEEPSDISEIQAEKNERLKRERKKYRKHQINNGFQLDSIIRIGKYKNQKTIKQIIETDKSYWNWLVANNVLLLHPEVKEYVLPKSI
jgi:hypothetical protein